MAKLIRQIASELTGFIMSRITAPRIKLSVPITISLEPEETANAKTQYIRGETKDLSKSGVAMILPNIRICEKYLVGESRTIYAEMDLPNGRIKVEFIGCRYEQLGIHDSIASYLIGARISKMSESDRTLYEEYLKYGNKLKLAKKRDLVAEVSES